MWPVAGVVAVAALGIRPNAAPAPPALLALPALPAPSPTVPTSGSQLSISVTPNPGYVGGTVAVDFVVHYYGSPSDGIFSFILYPALPAGMTASPMPSECTPVENGGCQLPGTYMDPATISVPYTLSPSAPGTYTITGDLATVGTEVVRSSQPAAAAEAAAESMPEAMAPVSVVLTVLQPSITVLPAVASPGQVVLVRGRDFPPGSAVGLAWRPGITAAAVPPVADAAGTFMTQMPVLGGDRTGERSAVASGTGFAAAVAPLLVTPDRLMPPLLGASGASDVSGVSAASGASR